MVTNQVHVYKSGDCSFCGEKGIVVRRMYALVFGVCHIPNNTPPSLHFIVVLSIKEQILETTKILYYFLFLRPVRVPVLTSRISLL